MAIDTIDKKHAVMKLTDQMAAPIIISETSPFSQGDKQQLCWGYPGILWTEIEVPLGTGHPLFGDARTQRFSDGNAVSQTMRVGDRQRSQHMVIAHRVAPQQFRTD